MLKSTDGGETWTPLDIEGVNTLETEPGTHRVFIPSNPACGQPIFGGGLCFSDDGGHRWQPTGENPGGIDNFTFAPGEPPIIYARTDQGLLKSLDSGQSWSRAAGELGRVPIYAVATAQAEDRNMLYAATTGGYVEDTAVQTLRLAATGGTLVNAGVYRYTSRSQQVYLPLVR
mgnify:FL=1